MDIEIILFMIIGVIAVISAGMMLLDDNVIHSALFLVINFACIAFLYLMLDAAFLAMVQIAVYAGAIMVLFLFVIMLLGAEKVTSGGLREFKYLAWIAAFLAAAFAIVIYVAINSGEINEKEATSANPLVRLAHVVPGVGAVNVLLDDEPVAEGLGYREFSNYVEIEPGEHTVNLVTPAGELLVTGSINAGADSVTTVVVYEDSGAVTLSGVAENLNLIEGRKGRLVVFNAYPGLEAVNLVEIDSDFRFADAEDAASAQVYAGEVAFGTASDAMTFNQGELRAVFAPGAAENADEIVLALRDFEITENTSTLVILGQDPAENSRAYIASSVTDTAFQFGGPESVGETLFTSYVLPLEMVAVLLLAAMVGAIVIAQRAELRPKPGRPTRRRVSRPLTSVIAQQTGHSVEGAGAELDIVDQPGD